MRLKKVDLKSGWDMRPKPVTVTVSEYGKVRISTGLQELMGLAPGDRVGFWEDEDKKGDWYIARDAEGLVARSEKKGGMCIYSKHLAVVLRDGLGVGADVVTKIFKVARKATVCDGVELYNILHYRSAYEGVKTGE